jgi:hypothetical protein
VVACGGLRAYAQHLGDGKERKFSSLSLAIPLPRETGGEGGMGGERGMGGAGL